MYDLGSIIFNDEGWKKKNWNIKRQNPFFFLFSDQSNKYIKTEREITSFLKLNINILSQFGPDSILYIFVPSWIFKDWKFSCQQKENIENCYPIFSWFKKKLDKERIPLTIYSL